MEKASINNLVAALLQCHNEINGLYREVFELIEPSENNFNLLKEKVKEREGLLSSVLVVLPDTSVDKQREINKLLQDIITDDAKIIDGVSKEQANVKNELAGMLRKNKKIDIYKKNAAKVK